MSLDVILSAALLLSFATFAVTHFVVALGLPGLGRPWWQSALALLPPLCWLAPYWSYVSGAKRRTLLWAGSLAAYILAWLAANSVG